MQLINDFQLVPTERGDGDLITARVFKGGQKGPLVSGAELVASVSWRKFFLLLATNGLDYEKFLEIHMLDDGLKLLDSAIIGAPYVTGDISGLELIPPNGLSFSFPSTSTGWQLQLLPKPRLRLPFVSEPVGVWRRFSFHSHFVVQRRA